MEEKLIPAMSALKVYFEGQRPRFEEYGFDIDVRPFGQNTMGGQRGVILTATSRQGVQKHTMSIESAVGMFNYVTINVDGELPPVADTRFPMPPDLVEHLQTHRLVDWLLDEHMAKQRPSN